MIDSFSLLLSHGLVLLACWRLLSRRDLDDESAADTAASQDSQDLA
ncbi:MAG: hypothetical protein ABI395_09105 [Sphingobium sp.]